MNRQDMEPDRQILNMLVKRIVETAQPIRIILFGSAAEGRMGPDSDLDVLVIMQDGTHRRRTAQQVYRCLSGIGVPKDIVVVTQSDVVYVRYDLMFRYIHDLDELLAALEWKGVAIPQEVKDVGILTTYAWEARYPGVSELVTDGASLSCSTG